MIDWVERSLLLLKASMNSTLPSRLLLLPSTQVAQAESTFGLARSFAISPRQSLETKFFNPSLFSLVFVFPLPPANCLKESSFFFSFLWLDPESWVAWKLPLILSCLQRWGWDPGIYHKAIHFVLRHWSDMWQRGTRVHVLANKVLVFLSSFPSLLQYRRCGYQSNITVSCRDGQVHV